MAQLRRAGRLLPADVRAMGTEEIIEKLRAFGVPFDPQGYQADTRRLRSAERLSNEWRERYPVTARGMDEDFLYLAAWILQGRLAPDVVTAETLDDWMQEGYQRLEERRQAQACDRWLQVWDSLRQALGNGKHTTDDADALVRGRQCVFNWAQDLCVELHNAGLEDPRYHERRIAYCREFCSVFEGQGDLLPHFRADEAEAHFELGRIEEGEDLFRRLVADCPRWSGAYMQWAAQYWRKDYAKADEIYQMALARRDLEGRAELLAAVAEMRVQSGEVADEVSFQPSAASEAVRPSPKIGRNDPCSCGSGRKYKRCCGA